jgi:hypothetical protein
MTTAAQAQAELDRRAAAASAPTMQSGGPTRAQAVAELQRRQAATPPAGADRFGRGMDAPLFDVSTLTEPQPQNARGGALMDVVRSGVSGLGRGATELAALPATIGGGLDALSERVGLIPAGSRVNSPSVGDGIRAAGSQITSGGTEYNPQTTTGEYAQTVGEFVGGGAGAKAGVVAGLASEGAGQATEGTPFEMPARIGAGLIAPAALARRAPATTSNLLRATDPDQIAAANLLQQAGVTPTAGQATQNRTLRMIEGTAEATGRQLEDFTAASMRFINSTSPSSRPAALASAQKEIVGRLDDAISGLNITVPQSAVGAVDDVVARWSTNISEGLRSGELPDLASQIKALAASGRTIPAETMRGWRSQIGALTTNSDDHIRTAAHGLRQIIDDLTDNAMILANRADDIPALAAGRNDYRNFLAIADAATRKGGASGTISPSQLNQAVIRTQGRSNYAIGQGTDIMPFARAGEEILSSLPTVSSGATRGLQNGASYTGGLLGWLLGGNTAAAIAGAAIPTAAQMVTRAPAFQNLLVNPSTAARGAAPLAAGLLAQEPQR